MVSESGSSPATGTGLWPHIATKKFHTATTHVKIFNNFNFRVTKTQRKLNFFGCYMRCPLNCLQDLSQFRPHCFNRLPGCPSLSLHPIPTADSHERIPMLSGPISIIMCQITSPTQAPSLPLFGLFLSSALLLSTQGTHLHLIVIVMIVSHPFPQAEILSLAWLSETLPLIGPQVCAILYAQKSNRNNHSSQMDARVYRLGVQSRNPHY
jgi:hypothetical protein